MLNTRILVLTLLVCVSSAHAQQPPRAIMQANLDGSGARTLLQIPSIFGDDINGLAVDPKGDKLYFTTGKFDDRDNGFIFRVNLDGSDLEELLMLPRKPRGIDLDVRNGRMYWALDEPGKANTIRSQIQSADLNGNDVVTIVGPEPGAPHGLALDVAGETIYWGNFSVTRNVKRVNFDGTSMQTLGSFVPGAGARGLDLDVEAGQLYLAVAGEQSSIRRSSLGGGGFTELITKTDGIQSAFDVALDLRGNSMYFTDRFGDSLFRANLTGDQLTKLPIDIINSPVAIALDVDAGKVYWSQTYVPEPSAALHVLIGIVTITACGRRSRRRDL